MQMELLAYAKLNMANGSKRAYGVIYQNQGE